MRSDDVPGPDVDRPELPGGHARRRLEQELTSRFGAEGAEADQSPADSDDEPTGHRGDSVQNPEGTDD